MCTLRNGNCLNDEVINVYLKSLAANNKKSVESGTISLNILFYFFALFE